MDLSFRRGARLESSSYFQAGKPVPLSLTYSKPRKITFYADERSNSKKCTGMTSPRSLFWRGQKRAHANHLRQTPSSGHPARGHLRSRQVSWLAGHNIYSSLPGAFGSSGSNRNDARRSQLRGQFRPCSAVIALRTEFPS